MAKPSSPQEKEEDWLENANSAKCLPWPVFYSRAQEKPPEDQQTHTAVLPLFADSAHSMGMMVHAMKVSSAAIKHLNPNQTPVLFADQPLFALLKDA